jgi:adenosylhomocysteine nucleosidase
MAVTKIGIIGAMDIEVALLKKEIKAAQKIAIAGLEFYSGAIAEHQVVLVKSGIGKVNAALCAQLLIREFGATHVINTGIAGAISPELRPLDIVLSTDAVYYDVDVSGFGYPVTVIPGMESVFRADTALIDAAEKACKNVSPEESHSGVTPLRHKSKFVRGRIATGDAFIASAEKKARIREICAPVCVEMEGAAIAHACTLNATPFIIIRCISDMADDSGTTDSEFNEKTAADMCARITIGMISVIP